MINKIDEIKCNDSLARIEESSLEPHTKDDLKASIQCSLENLNGRTLEERCASIARNQFDTTRFLAEIIIQFKQVADDVKKQPSKRSWKDVIVECRNAAAILGSVIAVCTIFQPQLVELIKAVASLF